jgi:molybdenum cofactor synthesis domain-containing protein
MSASHVPQTASLVVVGDEILAGEIPDENIHFMARSLTAVGLRVVDARVIPDRSERIVNCLREELARSDLVIVSGGIGPTHDDVTRQAIAEATGHPIVRHEEAESRLRAGFGGSITDAELSMADLPAAARLLSGRRTPAFGFQVERIYVLPGVPFYLRDIFDPLLETWSGPELHRHEIRSPLREGKLAAGLTRIQDAFPHVAIGSYPIHEQGLRVRIVIRSTSAEEADKACQRIRSLLDEVGAGVAPGDAAAR